MMGVVRLAGFMDELRGWFGTLCCEREPGFWSGVLTNRRRLSSARLQVTFHDQ